MTQLEWDALNKFAEKFEWEQSRLSWKVTATGGKIYRAKRLVVAAKEMIEDAKRH